MKKYDWILFDADDTLFEFNSFKGLQLMFSRYGVKFTKENYQDYQLLNTALWAEYQNGTVTAKQVQTQRFASWAELTQVSAQELNSSFLSAMAEISVPTHGAIELLNLVKHISKLGIITNGFVEFQQKRLERTGLTSYFDLVVASEAVGFAKPHPRIFEYALSNMGNPSIENVLMVGDTPTSDIAGGNAMGFDTCWLDDGSKELPEGILPTYQVSSLIELRERLLCAHCCLG